MPQSQIPQRQHYLPAVYLKQFSIDGVSARRDSFIWRLDRSIHKEVPVETQCHERFFYSATEPVAAEVFFGESEELFGQIAQRVWQGLENRGFRDYFGLLIFMISLHLRNPAYRFDLAMSRLEGYKLLEQHVVHHVFLRGSAAALTDSELLDLLKQNWRVRLLTFPESNLHQLVVSDNPSVWFSTNDSGDVHYIILPVTPHCCAIAFDCSTVEVECRPLRQSEVEVLNLIQAKSMINALYGPQPFSPQDQKEMPEFLGKRQPPSGWINAEEWKLNVLPHRPSLSFVWPKLQS